MGYMFHDWILVPWPQRSTLDEARQTLEARIAAMPIEEIRTRFEDSVFEDAEESEESIRTHLRACVDEVCGLLEEGSEFLDTIWLRENRVVTDDNPPWEYAYLLGGGVSHTASGDEPYEGALALKAIELLGITEEPF